MPHAVRRHVLPLLASALTTAVGACGFGPEDSHVASPQSRQAAHSSSPGSVGPSLSLSPAQAPDIQGETPPPHASVPPRPAPFGDLTIHEIYAAAATHGLACESSPFLDTPMYALGCEAIIDGVSYTLLVSYWAIDYIDGVHATVVSAGQHPIDSEAARPLFDDVIRATLEGEAELDALEYITAHFDDAACDQNAGCRIRVENGELMVIVGSNGARLLDLGQPRGE